MITFDPISKSVSGIANIKKITNKKKSSLAKFSTLNKTGNVFESGEISEAKELTSLIFLQEIDQFNVELEEINDFANNAFKSLKNIQLAMLNNNLQESHLNKLLEFVNKYKIKFGSDELSKIAEEIETRILVEIAKLEISRLD